MAEKKKLPMRYSTVCYKRKMGEFDNVVLDVFLRDQLKLVPKEVAQTREEAKAFLEDCMAVVVDSAKEVIAYFDEEGMDISDFEGAAITSADEVFDLGDGRFLIVEC